MTQVVLIPPVLVLFTVLNHAANATQPQSTGVALLRQEAAALEPLVESKFGRSVLEATADLPAIAPRTLYVDEATAELFHRRRRQSRSVSPRGAS